jgi:hypothetical protein
VIDRLVCALRRAATALSLAACVLSLVGVAVAFVGAASGHLVLWPVAPIALLPAALSVESPPSK